MIERYCEVVRLTAPALSRESWEYLARVPIDGTVAGLTRTLVLLREAGDIDANAILAAVGHDYPAMLAILDWIEQQTGGLDAAKAKASGRTAERAAAKWLAKPHRRARNREPRPATR